MFYINILSLDRSRSTIVTKNLALNCGGFALGEVSRCISPESNEKVHALGSNYCSCGEQLDNCSFWRRIISTENRENSFFHQIIDSSYLYVDSSKTIRHSRKVRKRLQSRQLLCVYLIRNFRDWSKSVRNASARNGEGKLSKLFSDRRFILSSIRLFLRRFYFSRLFEYYLSNARLILESAYYENSIIIVNSSQLLVLHNYLGNSSLYCPIENNLIHITRGNRVSSSDIKMLDWSEISFSVRILSVLYKFLRFPIFSFLKSR